METCENNHILNEFGKCECDNYVDDEPLDFDEFPFEDDEPFYEDTYYDEEDDLGILD